MQREITGMMIYYYMVCERKLWYFCNEIQMESFDENVRIGKALEEKSYQKEDKHINIDNIVNIDFIRSKKIIHEVKKSRKIEEASILQLKYYLYFLKNRGIDGISGKIDYPLLKQSIDVELTDEDEILFEDMKSKIKDIIEKETPPKENKKSICSKCAYYELCFI